MYNDTDLRLVRSLSKNTIFQAQSDNELTMLALTDSQELQETTHSKSKGVL